MKYYKGLKFVCAERIEMQTNIFGYEINEKLTSLSKDGILAIEHWYPWDGNSFKLFPDFKATLESSAGHDVLCDYVNSGLLPVSVQPLIDQFYHDRAIENGLWSWIARQATLAVRWYMLKKGKNKYIRKIYDSKAI